MEQHRGRATAPKGRQRRIWRGTPKFHCLTWGLGCNSQEWGSSRPNFPLPRLNNRRSDQTPRPEWNFQGKKSMPTNSNLFIKKIYHRKYRGQVYFHLVEAVVGSILMSLSVSWWTNIVYTDRNTDCASIICQNGSSSERQMTIRHLSTGQNEKWREYWQ